LSKYIYIYAYTIMYNDMRVYTLTFTPIHFIYVNSVRPKPFSVINRDSYKNSRYGKVTYSDPLPNTQAFSNLGLQSAWEND